MIAALVAVVVLTGVIGLMGGWSRAKPDGPRAVAPGTAVDVRPFRIQVDAARAVYEVDGDVADDGVGDPTTSEDDEEPRAYVVVDASISLDDRASVSGGEIEDLVDSDLRSTYNLNNARQEVAAPTSVHVAQDGSSISGIGPGLTYDVRLVFELDESAVPDRITVRFNEQTWRRSFIDGDLGWFDPVRVATVALDVAPLPPERPAEDVF